MGPRPDEEPWCGILPQAASALAGMKKRRNPGTKALAPNRKDKDKPIEDQKEGKRRRNEKEGICICSGLCVHLHLSLPFTWVQKPKVLIRLAAPGG